MPKNAENQAMKHLILSIFFGLFLIADLCFSFLQHSLQPFEGDIAGGVVPDASVQQILKNPLGTAVLFENAQYPNPNRYFLHAPFFYYFRKMPVFLNHFFQPIDSIYWAGALLKIATQFGFIYLLARLISGKKAVWNRDFLLAAALITPLFQTNGFANYWCILNSSVTYFCFYGLPCFCLLGYFFLFFDNFYHQTPLKNNISTKISYIFCGFIIALGGPLSPGIILIFTFLALIKPLKSYFLKINKLDFRLNFPEKIWRKWPIFIPISVFSLYSIVIGRYNSLNFVRQISISEMYARLPTGLFNMLFQKPAFSLILLILVINYFLLKKYDTVFAKKIRKTYQYLLIFSLFYILLLPLGGYRIYRPNVLRHDTFVPITLFLMFVFGISTHFLLKNSAFSTKKWYLPIIIGVLLVFEISDKPGFDRNLCEKTSLKMLADSPETIVKLPADCTILSWQKIDRPEDSILNGELLEIWGVTKGKKQYFQ